MPKKKPVSANKPPDVNLIISILLSVGLVVFFLIYFGTGIIAGKEVFLKSLRYDFNNPGSFILQLAISEIPYLLLALLWIYLLKDKNTTEKRNKKAGLYGAFIMIVIINVLLYASYYLDLLVGDISSTGSLIFIIYPFYALLAGGIGFIIGFLFYRKLLRD